MGKEGLKRACQVVNELTPLLKAEARSKFPTKNESFHEHFANGAKGSKKGLCQLISRQFFEREVSNLLAEAKGDRLETAIIQANRAPKSGLWLKAIPAGDTALSDADFRTCFRTRFGLAARKTESMPAQCVCGEDLQADRLHPRVCPKRRADWTDAHNSSMGIMARAFGDVGGFCKQEPRKLGLDPKDRTHPDLDGTIAGVRIISDLSHVTPTATSHLSSAQNVLGAADVRAQKKINKYGEKMRGVGKFFPMVMETTGGMQKDFAVALKEMAKAARHTGVWIPRDYFPKLRSRLAVNVQRWNAKIILRCLDAADRLDRA